MLTPILHDTPAEIAQPFDVKPTGNGRNVDPVAGKTMPQVSVVKRDYANLYKRFTSLGPLIGNARQWWQGHRLEHRSGDRAPEGIQRCGDRRGSKRRTGENRDSDIDATEVILMLAPETNGEVAVKAWECAVAVHRP